MIYSVYDRERKLYYYFSGSSNYSVTVPDHYNTYPFVPWQVVRVELPPGAKIVGTGEEPRGIIAHPTELQRPECRQRTEPEWMWAGALLLANWLLFKT